MTCRCKVFQNRLEILQTKYIRLKKEHAKLLGATITLIDALEELTKTGINNKWLNTLDSCFKSFMEAFEVSRLKILGVSSSYKPLASTNIDEMIEETEKVYNLTTESEKEYNEGFLARPRIPRTPQHY